MAVGRFPIPADSVLVGSTLAELCLPEDFLVIHIEREGETILPHGSTRLHAGDTATIMARDGDITKLENYWQEILAKACEEEDHLESAGE